MNSLPPKQVWTRSETKAYIKTVCAQSHHTEAGSSQGTPRPLQPTGESLATPASVTPAHRTPRPLQGNSGDIWFQCHSDRSELEPCSKSLCLGNLEVMTSAADEGGMVSKDPRWGELWLVLHRSTTESNQSLLWDGP